MSHDLHPIRLCHVTFSQSHSVFIFTVMPLQLCRYRQSLKSSTEQTVQSLPAEQTLEPSPAVQSPPAKETEDKETQ